MSQSEYDNGKAQGVSAYTMHGLLAALPSKPRSWFERGYDDGFWAARKERLDGLKKLQQLGQQADAEK